jgi:hypothetical protein
MMNRKTFQNVLVLLTIMALSGCAATGMKDVQESGFLGDYSQLKPGSEQEAVLVYVKSGHDFRPYDKIILDRTLVYLSPEAETRGIDPAVYKEMTDYWQKALIDEIKNGYQVVEQPGPGVLRVRTAITDIKPSKPVANTMSTILPVGWAVAGATKVASGENLGTGEAAGEMEVLDAMTGERLAAAVDRRQGGKGAFRGKWEDTKDALDVWAKRFRQRLDTLRGVK